MSKSIDIRPKGWEEVPKNESTQEPIKNIAKSWGAIQNQEKVEEPIQMITKSWAVSTKSEEGEEPIHMMQQTWGDISGILPPQTIRSFKGVNTLDSFSIEPEFLVNNKNISTKQFPTATVREGFSALGSVSGVCQGFMVWKEIELHAIVNGSWLKWNGSSWTSLATGLSTTAKPTYTNFKGNYSDYRLLMANGVDPVKMYDGTTVSNVPNAPAGMNFIVSHDNRVYGAVKNALHYSALRKADNWTTVDESGQIMIEDGAGEDITSLVAGTGHVVAFTRQATHELYGTNPGNYRLQVISEEVGCISHHTATMISGTLFFLSHDGIYRYNGGAAPRKDYALSMQGLFERMNTATYDKSIAGTDGERYYISLPLDGATKPNTTVEYDPNFDVWNYWDFGYTPSDYVEIKDNMHVGFEESRIIKMGGTTDNGGAIPFSLEMVPFSYNSLAANNRLYRLWVVADVPSGATVNVYINNEKKGNNWSLMKTITANTNLQATQILIPVTQSFHHNFVRVKIEGTGPVTIHELTRQERTFRFGIGG